MTAAVVRLADRAVHAPAACADDELDGMPTLDEIRRWPATVSVPLAGLAFGLSKSHAYDAVARNVFPARVIKVGGRYRVVTAAIVKALSEDD